MILLPVSARKLRTSRFCRHVDRVICHIVKCYVRRSTLLFELYLNLLTQQLQNSFLFDMFDARWDVHAIHADSHLSDDNVLIVTVSDR